MFYLVHLRHQLKMLLPFYSNEKLLFIRVKKGRTYYEYMCVCMRVGIKVILSLCKFRHLLSIRITLRYNK